MFYAFIPGTKAAWLLAMMGIGLVGSDMLQKNVEKITPERDKSFLETIRSKNLRNPFLFLPTMTKGGANISQDVRNQALAEAMERGATRALVEKLAKISQLKKAVRTKNDGWIGFGKTPLERAKNLNRDDYVRIIDEVSKKQDARTK